MDSFHFLEASLIQNMFFCINTNLQITLQRWRRGEGRHLLRRKQWCAVAMRPAAGALRQSACLFGHTDLGMEHRGQEQALKQRTTAINIMQ